MNISFLTHTVSLLSLPLTHCLSDHGLTSLLVEQAYLALKDAEAALATLAQAATHDPHHTAIRAAQAEARSLQQTQQSAEKALYRRMAGGIHARDDVTDTADSGTRKATRKRAFPLGMFLTVVLLLVVWLYLSSSALSSIILF